jgi:hypothetical protein
MVGQVLTLQLAGMTYNRARREEESRGVPICSESERIPCTLAFILKICRDREDSPELEEVEGFGVARSWKLIVVGG